MKYGSMIYIITRFIGYIYGEEIGASMDLLVKFDILVEIKFYSLTAVIYICILNWGIWIRK